MDTPSWQRTAEIAVTLLLVIIPWSFPSMGIAWRCVLWMVAWLLVAHLAFALIPLLGNLRLFIRLSLVVGATGFLAAALCLPIVSAWHVEKASEIDGTLTATETLPNDAEGTYLVEFGRSNTSFRFPLTVNQPFQILADKFIVTSDSKGRCLISTTVRDRNGNLIVDIHDNEWRVSNQTSLSWDKNYKSDMLEVLDGRGRVVLQVRLFTNGVQLQGEWHHENGNGVRIAARPGERAGFTLLNQQMPEQGNPIAPRFKYPSRVSWSELAN